MSPPNPTPPGGNPDPTTDGRRRTVTRAPPTDGVRSPTADPTAALTSRPRADDRQPIRRLRSDPRDTSVRFDRLERLLGGEGVRVPTDAPAGEESNVDENRGRADDAPPVHWIALCSPLGLTSGYALLGVVVGSNPVDASAPGWSRAIAFCLLVALLLDAGWTTGRLFEDATWWRDRPTAWTPNPFGYAAAGTLCLATAHLAVSLHAGSVERPGRYAAGVLLAALAFSSIVSGPLYVLQRRRRTGA